MVRARGGRETGMEIAAHLLHLLNGDIVWQQLVQFIGQLLAVDILRSFEFAIRRQIEMRHHHPGMHPSIRPASPSHSDLLPEQCRESTLQAFLYGLAIRLDLPAVIARTIIAECDEIALETVFLHHHPALISSGGPTSAWHPHHPLLHPYGSLPGSRRRLSRC